MLLAMREGLIFSLALNWIKTINGVPAAINILSGLNINSTIPSSETAIVSALFDRMNELESIVENSAASLNKAVNDNNSLRDQIAELKKDVEYLKNHVVYILENVD